MALPSSGSLSLAQIQAEFGGSNPIGLSEYYRGGAYVTSNNTNVPTSGTISVGNFYGAVRQFAFTISSNQIDANLRTLAINAGWDQAAPVVATINSGVIIGSSTTGAALTVSGSFPSGVVLTNNGLILGKGGAGGGGGGFDGYESTYILPFNGSAGGLALYVSTALSISNLGTIGGGGGGGGGGGTANKTDSASGGGGGGQGQYGGGAGAAGYCLPSPTANPGTAGAYNAIGSGGAGVNLGGTGGNGGSLGQAGSSGGAFIPGSGFPTPSVGTYPASGGAAGSAVSGNAYITWIATGTRYGAVA